MPEDTAITLGEISRAVTRLEAEVGNVRGDIKALEDKVPSKELVEATERAWNQTVNAMEERWQDRYNMLDSKVTDLEQWKTWLFRIVLGAVAVAVLSLVVISGGGGPA